MSTVVAFLAELIRLLLPALVELWKRENQPTFDDADPQTELRDRLRQKVRETWGLSRTNVRETS